MDILKREWAQARRLIGEGAIGKVAFARVQSSHGGPAAMAWPADPSWFYAKGAGPLLDMGVYGLDRITAVLGPARAVAAMSGVTAPVRRARGGPFDGPGDPGHRARQQPAPAGLRRRHVRRGGRELLGDGHPEPGDGGVRAGRHPGGEPARYRLRARPAADRTVPGGRRARPAWLGHPALTGRRDPGPGPDPGAGPRVPGRRTWPTARPPGRCRCPAFPAGTSWRSCWPRRPPPPPVPRTVPITTDLTVGMHPPGGQSAGWAWLS